MQNLLAAFVLLASCATHPAIAQKPQSRQTPVHKSATVRNGNRAKVDYKQPSSVPNWVAAEFCASYSRYFLDLAPMYKYGAVEALQDTPLIQPGVNLEAALAKSIVLREAVYKTLYNYCYQVKYGVGVKQSVDEVLFLTLYNELHLNTAAATILTTHINARYHQPAPSDSVDAK